jgi:hypothetical protein
MRTASLLCLQLALTSCSVISAPDISTPTLDDRFAFPTSSTQKAATLQTGKIDEASGLVRSVNNPGWLWSHNDSGDKARIFLIDPATGSLKMEVYLNGVKNTDFEDITLQYVDNMPHIVIGDIGDNLGFRDHLSLHRIPEPNYTGMARIDISMQEIATMRLQYEEGARDAETLMSTPNNDLVIVTKREAENYIYQFKFDDSNSDTTIHKLSANGRIALSNITAGDMNAHGEIVLRTYNQIYYWPALANDASTASTASEKSNASKTLSNPNYFRIPTQSEPQGEAICWTLDNGLYTVSEQVFNSNQRLYFYKAITEKK